MRCLFNEPNRSVALLVVPFFFLLAVENRGADRVRFPLPVTPHLEHYRIETTTNLALPFSAALGGTVAGFEFHDQATNQARFYRIEGQMVGRENLLADVVLNRLAYGPTPELRERLRAIGAEAYVREQLEPERLEEELDLDETPPLENGWQFVSATGTGISSDLWLTPDEGGNVVIDRIALVKGTRAEAGPNLIRNGDFEEPLGAEWKIGRDCLRTERVTHPAKSGTHALRMVVEFTQMRNTSVGQRIVPPLDPNTVYTLSYWYYRQTNRPNRLLTYLDGGGEGYGLSVSPDDALPVNTRVARGFAMPDDLRAWHIRRAVQAKRQLLEVLLQFVDNHFVTSITKSFDFLGYVYNGAVIKLRAGVQMEYKELQRWRAALLRPDCTFHELLQISAESPAMLLYLDTFSSRGIPGAIPNENYARELVELFTFGVDNGYDQADINALARVWTGWTVKIVDWKEEGNPFAPLSTNNLEGFPEPYWYHKLGTFAFGFEPDWHDQGEKTIFAGKRVPDRFGAPYAGRFYELKLPARSGTNGIQDGYEVLAHLARQPFTQECISAKLCRLFVHDGFRHGYDFAAEPLSPEARLVRECMAAWEASGGKVREVLAAIFGSELFRSAEAARQKVKTPLEFVVSAARALRMKTASGELAAEIEPRSLIPPLERMGRMLLFDRADPDGFPEDGPAMINASTVVERIRFAQALLSPLAPGRPQDAGSSVVHPATLIREKLPPESWQDPEKVVDYFLDLLFASEGRANLSPVQAQCVEFLNTAESGEASPFAALPADGSEYDVRLRGMVAYLIGSPRFQEQ